MTSPFPQHEFLSTEKVPVKPGRFGRWPTPRIVSKRLGHATVSITLDTYSHAIPAMQEEAAALIAGLVFAG